MFSISYPFHDSSTVQVSPRFSIFSNCSRSTSTVFTTKLSKPFKCVPCAIDHFLIFLQYIIELSPLSPCVISLPSRLLTVCYPSLLPFSSRVLSLLSPTSPCVLKLSPLLTVLFLSLSSHSHRVIYLLSPSHRPISPSPHSHRVFSNSSSFSAMRRSVSC